MNKHLNNQIPRLLKAILALLLLGLLLAFVQHNAGGTRQLAPAAEYELQRYSLSAGNGTWTSGGGYTLSGASSSNEGSSASGGGYTLESGMLSGTGGEWFAIYLPLVRK